MWAGIFSYAGLSFEALRGALLLTILFGIALSDARYYIIPDQFSLGGLVLGLGLAFLPGGIDPLGALFGAILGFGLLEFVAIAGKWMFKKDVMGGGDIKMMAMVGAFLGMWGVLLTIFLGALLGSVIFGPISYKTKKLVPFGIFSCGRRRGDLRLWLRHHRVVHDERVRDLSGMDRRPRVTEQSREMGYRLSSDWSVIHALGTRCYRWTKKRDFLPMFAPAWTRSPGSADATGSVARPATNGSTATRRQDPLASLIGRVGPRLPAS